MDKLSHELCYWKKRHDIEKKFKNSHYESLMLNISKKTKEFFKDKVVADFGCGPRGSLKWCENAKMRLGIDVLSDLYVDSFHEDILKHDTIYVKSTEKYIPVPSSFCDVVFTINSLDHAVNPYIMLNEIDRILKFSGMLFCSFNLNEPATIGEPNTLKFDEIISFFNKKNYSFEYEIAEKVEKNRDTYRNFYLGNTYQESDTNKFEVMWMRVNKDY